MPFWTRIFRTKTKRQVAKCVTECKSQAAEAKKVVSTLARTRKKRAQVAEGSAGEPEDFDSGDDWGSDEFDTGDEDEDRGYPNHNININEDGISTSDFTSDNLSTNGPESVASSDSSGQYNDVLPLDLRPAMPGRTGIWTVKGNSNGRELDTATPEPSVVLIGMSPLQNDMIISPSVAPKLGRSPIPKPPSAAPHQLGKLSGGMVNGGLSVQRRSVPRLQRPPSQPPAPPTPPKNKSEPETPASAEEDGWDEYEVPNSGIPGQIGVQRQPQTLIKVLPAAPVHFQFHPQQTSPFLSNGRSWTQVCRTPDATSHATDGPGSPTDDTYEPIDKPEEEETYEEVDGPRRNPQVSEQDSAVASSGTPTPSLPPRKPVSLPPHFLVPPLPEKPPKMINPGLSQPPPYTEFTPPLPSKGLNSSKSMSQLVNKVRSKLGGRRESNISAKDIEAASQDTNNNNQSQVTVTVTTNGYSSGVIASVPTPPPLPRIPAPSSPVTRPLPEELCSAAVRPLPPVPSSQSTVSSDEVNLDNLPYYLDVERDEAEQRLMALGVEDAYLVRPSRRAGPDNPHTLTLIHRARTFHLNIRLRPDGRYALGRKKKAEMVFSSVSALVEHHQQHPIYLSAHGENVGTALLRRHP